MNLFYLRVIGVGLLFSLYACETKPAKTSENQLIVSDTIVKLSSKPSKAHLFFIPENKVILDSTLFKDSSFSAFKVSLEGLNELDLLAIDEYLLSTLIANDKVIKSTLPEKYEVPAVKSRLRVVKTNLLRCRFYSQEEDIEALSLALKNAFDSYDILIKRIDDLALVNDDFSENDFNKNVFEVRQKSPKPRIKLKKN